MKTVWFPLSNAGDFDMVAVSCGPHADDEQGRVVVLLPWDTRRTEAVLARARMGEPIDRVLISIWVRCVRNVSGQSFGLALAIADRQVR